MNDWWLLQVSTMTVVLMMRGCDKPLVEQNLVAAKFPWPVLFGLPSRLS